MAVAIEFKGVNKWFGEHHVLVDVDLKVDAGEVIVVCGPSGSGKSTLIRCVNRLEPVQKGEISVLGEPITGNGTNLVKLRTGVGMVFQSFNLFPHMTVLQNIMLAPRKVKGLGMAEAEKIAEVLDVMTDLAKEGMTMMVVTHEMGFARRVASRVVFMDYGKIVEVQKPEAFFAAPQSDRAKDFLSKILTH